MCKTMSCKRKHYLKNHAKCCSISRKLKKIGDDRMGLFSLFGGKKTIELDKAKSDENKNRMREILFRRYWWCEFRIASHGFL